MNFQNFLLRLYKLGSFRGTKAERREAFFVLRRLKKREFKKVKKGSLVKDSFFNFSVFAYDNWSLHYLFSEIFISNEYLFEPETEKPLIIDCGANIGMSAIYFKWKFPGSRIIAFEPNPNAFFLLEKNIKENALKDIEIHNLGLSNRDGELSFFIDTYNPGTLIGSLIKKRGGPGELKVKTARLSSFVSEYERVDLVKMDVEGAELDIIKELSSSGMMTKVKEFIIEYHHNIPGENPDLSHFLSLFETNGYSYNIKAGFSKLRSFQDILIHFYIN